MKRAARVLVVMAIATGATAAVPDAQSSVALAAARQALGGDAKLSAVTSLTATGHNPSGDVEIAIQLPDKFMKKEASGIAAGMSFSRTSGFNGDGLISGVEMPPMPAGMNVQITTRRPQGTPDEIEADRKRSVLAAKQELARLALGLFAAGVPSYPLTFADAGQRAEAPGGPADVVDVTGADGFAARLYVARDTHLPAMLTWQGKEPVIVTMGGPGGARAEGGMVVMRGGPGTAADADRKTVEFRLMYGDYRDVDGIKVPFRLERTVDGRPGEVLTLEKVRINPRIDPSKFDTAK